MKIAGMTVLDNYKEMYEEMKAAHFNDYNLKDISISSALKEKVKMKKKKRKQFDKFLQKFNYSFVNEINECVLFNYTNKDKTKYQALRFDEYSVISGRIIYNYLVKQYNKGIRYD